MANYNVNSGQTIFDVLVNTILDLNSAYLLIKENNIPNILTDPLGYEIKYSEPIVVPAIINSQKVTTVQTEKYFYSIPNQSVFDIVIQTYNDLNKTYKLIQDSNFNNTLTYPVTQTLFKFNPTLATDAIFNSYLSKNGIIINTVKTINNKYLLQEDGFVFDLEDGSGKIELE